MSQIPIFATQTYRPLEFTEPWRLNDDRLESDMRCVWAGIAAVVVMYMLSRQTVSYGPHAPPVPRTYPTMSAMVSRLNPMPFISARLATETKSMPPMLTEAMKKSWGMEGLDRVFFIDDNLTAKDRLEENLKRFTNFVTDADENAVVILYANWCPHCKDLIHRVSSMLSAEDAKTLKILLVNAESVHPSAFHGESRFIDLEFYPTICTKTNEGFNTALDIPTAAKTVSKAETEKSTVASGNVVAAKRTTYDMGPYDGDDGASSLNALYADSASARRVTFDPFAGRF